MSLWYWFSRECLFNRSFLLALFVVNVLGTIYGYVWYWDQIVETVTRMPPWLVLFVPDSPTASLWFTVSLGLLLFAPRAAGSAAAGWIAALGAVSSVKYGVWAVAMNAAVAAQGERLVWEEWMLIASHLGMAVEALLFIGRFRVRAAPLVFTLLALLLNDWLDYHALIYPWLRDVLLDDLAAIELFTWTLTLVSTALVALVIRWSKIGHPPIR
ncbi:DUF1405 domain-containing protein [Paenibacillus flagellatus]|uniref:DUF1405 domain-containing protein n=1 Tax=Paenibacillus flagellatus TaxID=2211139 RepID=A0A2V5KYB2_9BACL|nr:DUF1405 domain-containing protein [Paenibacillus flagellatus]PYI54896.1 DUF1405 domain-containing protein [Paenibacillus flagellatus]